MVSSAESLQYLFCSVLYQTDFTFIYAGVNIPISGYSATSRLDIKILPNCMSSGDPKRCDNNLLKSRFHFYLTISSYIYWAELMVPTQIYLGPIWRHTYTRIRIYMLMVNSLPCTCIHQHEHTYTHTSIQTYPIIWSSREGLNS